MGEIIIFIHHVKEIVRDIAVVQKVVRIEAKHGQIIEPQDDEKTNGKSVKKKVWPSVFMFMFNTHLSSL